MEIGSFQYQGKDFVYPSCGIVPIGKTLPNSNIFILYVGRNALDKAAILYRTDNNYKAHIYVDGAIKEGKTKDLQDLIFAFENMNVEKSRSLTAIDKESISKNILWTVVNNTQLTVIKDFLAELEKQKLL